MVAGYYSANGQLYRFAAAELAPPAFREKAVSLVLAGGLLGAVAGPNLANHTRNLLAAPFAGAYMALVLVGLLSMLLMAFVRLPPSGSRCPSLRRAARHPRAVRWGRCCASRRSSSPRWAPPWATA